MSLFSRKLSRHTTTAAAADSISVDDAGSVRSVSTTPCSVRSGASRASTSHGQRRGVVANRIQLQRECDAWRAEVLQVTGGVLSPQELAEIRSAVYACAEGGCGGGGGGGGAAGPASPTGNPLALLRDRDFLPSEHIAAPRHATLRATPPGLSSQISQSIGAGRSAVGGSTVAAHLQRAAKSRVKEK